MRISRPQNFKELARISSFISTIFLVIITAIIWILYSNQISAELEALELHSITDLDGINHLIEKELEITLSDLRYLAGYKKVKKFFNNNSDPRIKTEIEELFSSVSIAKKRYDQIRILDKNGMEKIRVNKKGEGSEIVDEEKLQNKGQRYYFKDTFNLNADEIFISPMDLNIERGEIEQPIKPMIRFGMPIVDDNGNKQGVLLINYLGDYLIKTVMKAMPHLPGKFSMLNRDSYWLISESRENEWGFMFPEKKDVCYANIFQKDWDKITDVVSGQFYSDYGLITFLTLFPLVKGTYSSTGAGIAAGKSEKQLLSEEYYWKMVIQIPNEALFNQKFNLAYNYFYVWGVLLVVSIVGSVFWANTIIKKRLATELLRESEDRLTEEKYLSDLLLRTIPDSVYFKDKNSQFIKLNQAGIEKLGFESEEQVLGKSDSDFFGAEYAQEAERDEKYILENQKPIINKLEKEVWPNGKESWVITSKFPLYNNEGALEGTFGISRDVTKLIEVEEELRESQQRLNLAVQASNIGIWNWDIQTNELNWDTNMSRMFGLDLLTIQNYENFSSALHPDDRDRVNKEVQDAIENHTLFDTDYRVVHNDGSIRNIMAQGSVEYGNENSPLKMNGICMDVTERRAAEKALVENEQRLREAQQIAHIGHWELEMETSILKWSDEAFRIFGFAPQEFKPTLDIFVQRLHPDDREIVLSSFENSVSRKLNYSITHRIIRPDDEIRYVSEVGKTFYEGETPVRSIGTVQDITELKEAEKALMESESRFRTLITNMPSVVFRCKPDKESTMLYISDPIENLTGFPSGEFIMNSVRTFSSIIHPDDTANVKESVNAAVNKREAWQINYRILSKDNGIKWVNERGNAYFENEVPIWLDGVIYDVTDQKIAEQALEESTRRLELALEAANAGSYFWDLETDGMLMDEMSYELYGIERRDDLKNTDLLEYVHKDDLEKTGPIVNKAIENSETFHIEFRIFQPGGELKYAAAHGFVIKNDIDRPIAVAGLHFDITKRKEDEALLEEAKAGAEEASQAKSEFLARMSHELRTPLNGILGYAQILKREENLSKIQKKGLSIIESSGQHLLDLINDILDLSKIEARQFDLHLQNFELDQLITTIGQLIKIKAETKGISFYWKSEGIENKVAVGDPRALRQILLNLLGNAVKFTDQGNVLLNVYYDNEIIKLEIIDTGIGISADKLEDIFEPFKQTGDKAKTVEGTGLGLAITRKLVEMMNGKITVESETDKGSKFSVELYLPVSTETLASTKQVDMEICGYEGDVKTIIVADDIKTNLSLLESILEPLNFNLLTAMNGKEVINLVNNNKVDLVLMDIVMPEMDGSEATQILKSNPETKHIPVIAVTASISKKQLDTIEEKQYDDYLSKPFPLDLLYAKIQQQLELTWKFKSKEIVGRAVNGSDNDGTIVLPEEELINTIMEYAELGAFSKISDLTEKLIEDSEKYSGFADKVNGYVANYDEDGLLDYLKNL